MYIVSYTSPTEGMTIGATGDTMVEALAKLTDEFGEGITVLYEHTHHQLLQQSEAVQEAAAPRDVEPELTDEQIQKYADEAEEGYTKEQLQERESLAIFRGEDVPDDQPAAAGGSDEPAAEDAGGEEADAGGDGSGGGEGGSGPTCKICGNSISEDRAIASRITVGEERCSDCAA